MQSEKPIIPQISKPKNPNTCEAEFKPRADQMEVWRRTKACVKKNPLPLKPSFVWMHHDNVDVSQWGLRLHIWLILNRLFFTKKHRTKIFLQLCKFKKGENQNWIYDDAPSLLNFWLLFCFSWVQSTEPNILCQLEISAEKSNEAGSCVLYHNYPLNIRKANSTQPVSIGLVTHLHRRGQTFDSWATMGSKIWRQVRSREMEHSSELK